MFVVRSFERGFWLDYGVKLPAWELWCHEQHHDVWFTNRKRLDLRERISSRDRLTCIWGNCSELWFLLWWNSPCSHPVDTNATKMWLLLERIFGAHHNQTLHDRTPNTMQESWGCLRMCGDVGVVSDLKERESGSVKQTLGVTHLGVKLLCKTLNKTHRPFRAWFCTPASI